jgi:hypothetical protein
MSFGTFVALAPIWVGLGILFYAAYLAFRYGVEFRRKR